MWETPFPLLFEFNTRESSGALTLNLDCVFDFQHSQQKWTRVQVSPPTSAKRQENKWTPTLMFYHTQYKNKNITTDIKVDTNSNVFTTITVDEAAPGHFVEQLIGRISNQHLRT
nr:mitochondrial outer membrane protein porin of 34 kDa [Ipomoea trifida]